MTVAGKGGAGPAGLLWLILCCLGQAQRRHVNTECCQWALFSEAQYVPDVRILTASSHCVIHLLRKEGPFLILHRVYQFSVLAHPGCPGLAAVAPLVLCWA